MRLVSGDDVGDDDGALVRPFLNGDGWDEYVIVDAGTRGARNPRYDWRNDSVLVVHALSAIPREIALRPGGNGTNDGLLVNLLADGNTEARNGSNEHSVLLEPYGYRWYRVGGLDYLLRHTDA